MNDNPRPTKECPRCHCFYNTYPSLSRRDNKTDICPKCGDEEALVDFAKSQGYNIPLEIALREIIFKILLRGLPED